MDRSMAAFLQLPMFDDEFTRALCRLGLGRSEFWLALDADEGADDQIVRMLGAMGGDQDDRDVVLRRIELVPLLLNLIFQSRSKIMGEIATDLGYGHGSAVRPPSVVEPQVCGGPKDPRIPLFKKPKVEPATTAVGSLKSEEENEKLRWAARLKAIAAKAGSHAQINQSLPGAEITAGEQAEIRELVFGAGAFRTIRVNVLAWERMEKWAGSQGLSVYPLTNSVFSKYCLRLSNSGCGPSVLPALVYAVRWICKRLVMPVPDTDDPHVGAIVQRVYNKHRRGSRDRATMAAFYPFTSRITSSNTWTPTRTGLPPLRRHHLIQYGKGLETVDRLLWGDEGCSS